MTAFFLLPFLMLLVVILQITLLDVLALRWVNMEISLICVIYAGFHFDALRGGLMALMLGFFLDCLTSAIFGLYTFLYVVIFYFSMTISGKVYSEKPVPIALFTGLCALLEGLVIVLLYRFLLGAEIYYAIPRIFIPQAIVLGALSPLVFRLFRHIEDLFHARETRPARQL
jgi:rod shape-determining protein MreD